MAENEKKLRHIAFIMDGNGRWAKKRMMPREFGHKEGAKVFKEVIRRCGELGIDYVTVYAFSTENWRRSEKEVNSIMNLLSSYIDEARADENRHAVSVKFIGDMTGIDPQLAARARELEEYTKHFKRRVNIALNYGGRDEIVKAVNRLIAEGKTEITEEDISASIYSSDCPEPDFIVRTGGEYRLSNFLTWQGVYSELYFTDVLWPDIRDEDIDRAVDEFYKRNRRFGKA